MVEPGDQKPKTGRGKRSGKGSRDCASGGDSGTTVCVPKGLTPRDKLKTLRDWRTHQLAQTQGKPYSISVSGAGCQVGAGHGTWGHLRCLPLSRRSQENSNKANWGLVNQGLEPGLVPEPGVMVLGLQVGVQRPYWETERGSGVGGPGVT